MDDLKKFLILIAILVIAVIDIAIYWDQHLYYKARNLDDYEERIEILDKAINPFSLNDLVFFELGRAYYEQGEDSFGEEGRSEASFNQSISHFSRSIRINPSSHLSHFYLGRALLSKSLITQSTDNDFFNEYRKAALLVDQYASIYFDVGKLFLSHWRELSEEERKFTLMMLREIWKGENRGKILSLLSIWEMNVKDYDVMRKILPKTEKAYQQYAKYLGERSLDLEERHHYLAESEFLSFQKANDTNNSGERDLYYMRLKQASEAFKKCLRSLDQIRFYQDLSNQILINQTDFVELQKLALLNLIKSSIAEGKDLNEVKEYFKRYLRYNVTSSEVNDFERYLIDRDLLSKKLEYSYNDLDRFSFHLLLYFKQNRYSDIVRLGRSVQNRFGVIPEKLLSHYVEILLLVGDSHQKNGSYYTARDFYQMAREHNPQNLEVLQRIRINFEQLNDRVKLREINNEIDNILSPKGIILRNPTINKGKSYSKRMIFDGRRIEMDFHFEEDWEEKSPLISIFFNGRVVWENYLEGNVLPLFLDTESGVNKLEVKAVNRPVQLMKITWKSDQDD